MSFVLRLRMDYVLPFREIFLSIRALSVHLYVNYKGYYSFETSNLK